uniref:Uncharacterized protein n=1 Tax=Anguilla anguilla TaxID=7936 RepID=A0A0E9RZR3_ANGAN
MDNCSIQTRCQWLDNVIFLTSVQISYLHW